MRSVRVSQKRKREDSEEKIRIITQLGYHQIISKLSIAELEVVFNSDSDSDSLSDRLGFISDHLGFFSVNKELIDLTKTQLERDALFSKIKDEITSFYKDDFEIAQMDALSLRTLEDIHYILRAKEYSHDQIMRIINIQDINVFNGLENFHDRMIQAGFTRDEVIEIVSCPAIFDYLESILELMPTLYALGCFSNEVSALIRNADSGVQAFQMLVSKKESSKQSSNNPGDSFPMEIERENQEDEKCSKKPKKSKNSIEKIPKKIAKKFEKLNISERVYFRLKKWFSRHGYEDSQFEKVLFSRYSRSRIEKLMVLHKVLTSAPFNYSRENLISMVSYNGGGETLETIKKFHHHLLSLGYKLEEIVDLASQRTASIVIEKVVNLHQDLTLLGYKSKDIRSIVLRSKLKAVDCLETIKALDPILKEKRYTGEQIINVMDSRTGPNDLKFLFENKDKLESNNKRRKNKNLLKLMVDRMKEEEGVELIKPSKVNKDSLTHPLNPSNEDHEDFSLPLFRSSSEGVSSSSVEIEDGGFRMPRSPLLWEENQAGVLEDIQQQTFSRDIKPASSPLAFHGIFPSFRIELNREGYQGDIEMEDGENLMVMG